MWSINQLPASPFKFSLMIIWAYQELKSDSALHRKPQPHSLSNHLDLALERVAFSAPKGFESSVLLFKKCMWVFCLYVCLHQVHAVPVEARRESGPLELELQNAVSCQVDAGN